MRHPGEQYAWPRSHDGQMAKTRLQRRQVFWRSGVSTVSEQRDAPTGHPAQTVAQERRLARSVGASRRSPRVRRSYTPGPHLVPQPSSAYARYTRRPNQRLWTLPHLWTHRTRPQGACKTAQTAVSHSAHNPHAFFVEEKKKNPERSDRCRFRFARFQVSVDKGWIFDPEELRPASTGN